MPPRPPTGADQEGGGSPTERVVSGRQHVRVAALSALQSHGLFGLMLVVGLTLRVMTSVAYRPALHFIQDSFDYLGDADALVPGVVRPLGYPVFLRFLSAVGDLAVVPVAQHLLGLATAMILNLLLRHLGARPWVAALGAAPVLLDPSQIYIEQFIMAETLFQFFVVAALAVLVWNDRPSVRSCAAVGALIGAASLTRTVGLVLLVCVLAYVIGRRVGWKPLLAIAAAAAVLIVPYGLWFRSVHGHFGLEAYRGYFLAGRVLPFADCTSLDLPPLQRKLCDERPVEERPRADLYVWDPASQLRHWAVPPGTDRNALAQQFASTVIRNQPGDYLAVVADETLHYFSPRRQSGLKDFPAETLLFATSFPPRSHWRALVPPGDPYVWHWTNPGPDVAYSVKLATHGFGLRQVDSFLNARVARVLRIYQGAIHTPGTALAFALLAAMVAGVGRLSRQQRRLRWAALLFAGSGLAVLLTAAATSSFDYRYLVPAFGLIPPGGAMGALLLEQRFRAPRSSSIDSLRRTVSGGWRHRPRPPTGSGVARPSPP